MDDDSAMLEMIGQEQVMVSNFEKKSLGERVSVRRQGLTQQPDVPFKITRVYFNDGTFKSFKVTPDDTVQSLIESIASKMQLTPFLEHFCLHDTAIKGRKYSPRVINSTESPFEMLTKWEKSKSQEKHMFTFVMMTQTELAKLREEEEEKSQNTTMSIFKKQLLPKSRMRIPAFGRDKKSKEKQGSKTSLKSESSEKQEAKTSLKSALMGLGQSVTSTFSGLGMSKEASSSTMGPSVSINELQQKMNEMEAKGKSQSKLPHSSSDTALSSQLDNVEDDEFHVPPADDSFWKRIRDDMLEKFNDESSQNAEARAAELSHLNFIEQSNATQGYYSFHIDELHQELAKLDDEMRAKLDGEIRAIVEVFDERKAVIYEALRIRQKGAGKRRQRRQTKTKQ